MLGQHVRMRTCNFHREWCNVIGPANTPEFPTKNLPNTYSLRGMIRGRSLDIQGGGLVFYPRGKRFIFAIVADVQFFFAAVADKHFFSRFVNANVLQMGLAKYFFSQLVRDKQFFSQLFRDKQFFSKLTKPPPP